MKAAIKSWLLERLAVAVAFGVLIVASLAYFGGWISQDLGGNLFAEALGIALTVGLIDRIIRSNEKRRTRAARYAAYESSRLVLARFCSTWATLIKVSSSQAPPQGDDLLSDGYIALVVSHLDLNGEVTRDRIWRDQLATIAADLKNIIDRTIQRYSSQLDPDLLSVLEQFDNSILLGYLSMLPRLNPVSLHVSPMYSETFEILRRLRDILAKQAPEFHGLTGFVAPYDLAFRDEIDAMRNRNDILPRLGSSRIANPSRSPVMTIGGGLPPHPNQSST